MSKISLLLLILVSFSAFGNIKKHSLYSAYNIKYKSNKQLDNLKKKTLAMNADAVPLLTHVMKSDTFPEKNRWVATFMLGQIMGKKSKNYISKFTDHPNWMLRLASLKTLMSLNAKEYKGIYTKMLKDKSLIVRTQSLEAVRYFDLKELSPYVWAMLYDKRNYLNSKGSVKRSHIIKGVIKVVGDLKFEKAVNPMITMLQKKKYKDIHNELDYALIQITGQDSPTGGLAIKKNFWNNYKKKNTII